MEALLVILAVLAAIVGAAAGYQLSRRGVLGRVASEEARAARLLLDSEAKIRESEAKIRESEAQAKEIVLAAKEEAVKVQSATEMEARQQRGELKDEQNRLRQREESLERKNAEAEERERRAAAHQQEVEARAREIEELRDQHAKELERVAQLTRQGARDLVMSSIEVEMRDEGARRARHILNQARLDADEQAKRVVALAVQRPATDQIG